MKKMLIAALLLLSAGSLPAQEFKQYSNGLIYSDTTIGQLRHIVDSLNLKYKVCNDHPRYAGWSQGRAHFLRLSGPAATQAKDRIKKGTGFDELVAAFPGARQGKDYLVTRDQEKAQGKNLTIFRIMKLDNNDDRSITVTDPGGQYLKAMKGKWAFEYYGKSEYSEESLEAIYITEEFAEPEIPLEYARMIQYVDCMVDTNYRIFRENASEATPWAQRGTPKSVKGDPYDFVEFVENAIHMPEFKFDYEKGSDEEYIRYKAVRDSLQWARIDSLSITASFKTGLQEAVRLAMDSNEDYDTDMFESIVEKYGNPADALELKRRRRVMGHCSMDRSPRYHAQAIARLSAETINWDIFLRAHLDIMNDRFDRVSDGSYAWAGRKTYIKELETLNFDVPALLLGTVFRFREQGNNHYWGNIGRIGRALSETGQPEVVERQLLHIIGDSSLDLYNRLLFYYLFLHYNYNLEDKVRQKANVEQVKIALATFPEYMRKDAVVRFGDDEG